MKSSHYRFQTARTVLFKLLRLVKVTPPMSDCTFRVSMFVFNETQNLVLSIQLLPSVASLRALACVPGRLFRDRDKKAAKTRAKRRRRSFACVFPIFCLAKQTDTATNEGLECEPSLFNLFTVVNFIYHLSWSNKFFVSLPTNTAPHYINNIFFQS